MGMILQGQWERTWKLLLWGFWLAKIKGYHSRDPYTKDNLGVYLGVPLY